MLQCIGKFRTCRLQYSLVIGEADDSVAFRHGEQHRHAVVEHDDRFRSARRFHMVLFGPCDRGACQVGRVGHVERHAGLAARFVVASQGVHCVTSGELGRSESFDEHASDQIAVFLHAFEYRV